ncbi:hypothetical protein LR48_Vigan583s002900 [Vigna angularis]|uniref:GRF-type domain-containing protein n=1 Tax=Phaseolus angularis TaxID=3914 RepID=A0A0L9TE24_PHAAN|nr:hypothetical protein LR48_Vigan583s002900 [Vigna angularis]
MKADSGGIGCTRRSIGSGMSQTSGSSSHLASIMCGCGERMLVLKATTLKNRGRLFYRCRNWASNGSCNYFEWVDEGHNEIERSLQRKSEEVEVCMEKVVLDLRKKKDKLKRKLEEERKNFKMMLVFFVLSWALTVMLFSLPNDLLPPSCILEAPASMLAPLADLLGPCDIDAAPASVPPPLADLLGPCELDAAPPCVAATLPDGPALEVCLLDVPPDDLPVVADATLVFCERCKVVTNNILLIP